MHVSLRLNLFFKIIKQFVIISFSFSGFASGQLIKKHQNKITSTEMKNLSDKTMTPDSPKTGQ